MRILVFGVGVLGSYLAHALLRGGNEVTILARGKRAEQLNKDGLVIRHYFQRKTTVDAVKVINFLQPDDIYDLIFVVMKYNDFPAVLPILANNQSSNIVLVGNNADAHGMQNFLEEKSLVKKNVVFGFQLSGGRKEENGRIICVRGVGKMVLGSLNGNIPFKPLLENAFEHTKYQLAYHDDIDAWLKSHIILIVPLNAASFIQNGNLKEVAKNNELLKQIISAMDEGFTVLEQLGYSVTPAGLVNFIRKHRLGRYIVFRLYHNLPFVKLVDGSFGEIVALYDSFDKLKQKSALLTANWDKLKKQSTSKFIGEK